jgi:hypothetical protein
VISECVRFQNSILKSTALDSKGTASTTPVSNGYKPRSSLMHSRNTAETMTSLKSTTLVDVLAPKQTHKSPFPYRTYIFTFRTCPFHVGPVSSHVGLVYFHIGPLSFQKCWDHHYWILDLQVFPSLFPKRVRPFPYMNCLRPVRSLVCPGHCFI